EQLGVGELDARGDALAVVDQDADALGLQLPGQAQRDLDLLALAGGDHVHVGGGHGARPDDALVVVGLLDDGGDHAGDPDAVGAHGDPLGLAVRAERVHLEGVGVLAAQLEEVADLDAARAVQGAAAVRRGVAVAHVGDVEHAVRGEVPAADQVDHVVVALVRAGDAGDAGDHPRVGVEGQLVALQRGRAYVALDQVGVRVEVGLFEQGDLGRLQGGLQPLHVDLAVAGHADADDLPLLRTRLPDLDQDVLQGVGGGEGAAQAGPVEVVDEGLDGGGVRGVVHGRLGQALDRPRGRRGDLDRLDVGRVVRLGA